MPIASLRPYACFTIDVNLIDGREGQSWGWWGGTGIPEVSVEGSEPAEGRECLEKSR